MLYLEYILCIFYIENAPGEPSNVLFLSTLRAMWRCDGSKVSAELFYVSQPRSFLRNRILTKPLSWFCVACTTLNGSAKFTAHLSERVEWLLRLLPTWSPALPISWCRIMNVRLWNWAMKTISVTEGSVMKIQSHYWGSERRLHSPKASSFPGGLLLQCAEHHREQQHQALGGFPPATSSPLFRFFSSSPSTFQLCLLSTAVFVL